MMDRTNIIYLVSVTYEKDQYGVNRAIKTQRKVYCDVSSVTSAEFFQGGAQGLKPDLRFVMSIFDYKDENGHAPEELIFEGKTYSIYRTYIGKNDDIELYTERKQGVN